MSGRLSGIPFLSILFGFALSEVFADYPGNENFRNVSSGFAAKSRTDWVTNVTTMVGSARNPGVSTPIDWSLAQPITNGVDYIPAILTTDGGWPRKMVCHFVRIDLKTPNLRFTGTDRCADWGDPMPEDYASGYEKRTVREKTTDFLARNRGAKSLGGKARNAVLAWNNAAWSPWISPYSNLWGSPNGPLYSDGIQVSEIATGYGTHSSPSVPNGMLAVFKDGTADLIPQMTKAIAKRTWFCVPAFVARLVSSGQVPTHGDTSVDPRTAIGISQDKRYIYLITCDGRRDGWSSGCDFPSLSTLLVAMGCWDAINLDGGGSSTLCTWNEATGKPSVLNRPSSSSSWNLSALRDNGSNAAIYFKAPDAKLGSWIYDDFDFLMQDIADGETPSSTSIDVLGDATFTAAHPCISSGTYTLSSTNNASIGWEEGVTPRIASGTTVTFRDIRFREGSRALTVESGATAVLSGGADLDEVDTLNSGGLVLAGSLVGPLRVNCATATQPGDVFATSSLSLSETQAQLGSIFCGTDDDLVAVASESGGTVQLAWDRLVDFGATSGSIASTKDRADVSVTVSSAVSHAIPAGALLKLTLTSEDGRRSSVQTVAFSGPGTYTFHTAASSDPTICGSGYAYTYTVELADSTGTRIPHTATTGGRMSLGVEAPWFAAAAADDSAVGGLWDVKPSITQGQFSIEEGTDDCFEATETRNGRVRLTLVATFHGAITRSRIEAKLDEIAAMETKPLGAALVTEANDDTLVWCCLVGDNGAPSFRELAGPVVLDAPCTLVQEVDWSSGAPLVSYLASTNGTDFVRLADGDGTTWFDSASSESDSIGRVEFTGVGLVDSFAGTSVRRVFAPSIIKIR